jgi:hypothetical protein
VNCTIPSAGYDEFTPSFLGVQRDFQSFLGTGRQGKFCRKRESITFFLQTGEKPFPFAPARAGINNELNRHGSLKKNILVMPGAGPWAIFNRKGISRSFSWQPGNGLLNCPAFFRQAYGSASDSVFSSCANGSNPRAEGQGGRRGSRSPSKKIRLLFL